jgi:hypothetical protein
VNISADIGVTYSCENRTSASTKYDSPIWTVPSSGQRSPAARCAWMIFSTQYLFVGQRPARLFRGVQHVPYQRLTWFAAVDGEPVPHVARARGRIDDDLLIPAEQARRYPGVHAVLGERVALLVRLEDRRRVHPRTGLEDVAPHRRIVPWDGDAEYP